MIPRIFGKLDEMTYDETPIKTCSLVARKIWGDGGEPNR